MLISGLQKLTLIDYPNKIAATVFTTGCNFRCPYCHNSDIVDPRKIDYENGISEKEILDFLNSRKGDLDGVCITGGEPTLQIGLMRFIEKIKEIGLSVKIDTNGSNHNAVRTLIENDLVDYWAIDIKTAPEKYKIMTRENNFLESIEKTINAITNSNNDLEFRTTVVRGYVNYKDIDDIAVWINSINDKTFSKLYRYSIQTFKPQKTLRDNMKKVALYSDADLKKMAEKMKKYCKNVVLMN